MLQGSIQASEPIVLIETNTFGAQQSCLVKKHTPLQVFLPRKERRDLPSVKQD